MDDDGERADRARLDLSVLYIAPFQIKTRRFRGGSERAWGMGNGAYELAASSLLEDLLAAEVRRIVDEAARKGSTLSASAAATEIARICPDSGLDHRSLAERVMLAASVAGVGVQIGTTDHDPLKLERAFRANAAPRR